MTGCTWADLPQAHKVGVVLVGLVHVFGIAACAYWVGRTHELKRLLKER